ncbi:MAG TPA: PhzF family phenazine biosynthesis protein [Acidobacteriota bacterium]|nr:PhzF family phenazine biosynthesis protein [Acidobacteriota bacterium]
MPEYPFLQVDAFTDKALSGNPCAIILDADDLSEASMLAIAKEMNLSETSFVLRSRIADVRARYFTPAEEIPLAGHPTIATIFALVETGRLKLQGERTTIRLELKVGPIQVEIEAKAGRAHNIIMSQKRPAFLRTYTPEEVLPAFQLKAGDELPGAIIQTVSTGTPQLMVPLKDHDALRSARMDIGRYEALRRDSDFFSPHLFCLKGFTNQGRTSARHFGAPPDTMEDPFTGSATGGMAAYLWQYGLIDSPRWIAEQGHWMQRPGTAHVEVVGPRDAIETVRVGGSAVIVLRGALTI